jgi:CRP-like cAMP-binding protein
MLIPLDAHRRSPGPRCADPSSTPFEQTLRKGAALQFPERAANLALEVVSGCVRLCHPLIDGRRQITDFLFPEDRITVSTVRMDHGTIEAVTPATLRFSVAYGHDDGPLRERLEALQSQVFLLGHKNAREKLAAFLVKMSDRLAGGDACFRLPMSRHDISDYLCVSPETVCRNFTQLVADGLVKLPDAQSVQIVHRASLEFIAR